MFFEKVSKNPSAYTNLTLVASFILNRYNEINIRQAQGYAKGYAMGLLSTLTITSDEFKRYEEFVDSLTNQHLMSIAKDKYKC